MFVADIAGGFGQTPAGSAAPFGASFSLPASTASQPAAQSTPAMFGGTPSASGQAAQSAPAFGFGSSTGQAAPAAPAFGQSPAASSQAKPAAFGVPLGQPAASSQAAPALGQPAASGQSAPSFGGFGFGASSAAASGTATGWFNACYLAELLPPCKPLSCTPDSQLRIHAHHLC